MKETTEYKGHELVKTGDHWETLIGGLWHKRKTYDAMRDHLDRINGLAGEPWPEIVFPVNGRPVPQKVHYAAADLLSAIMQDFPNVVYHGERKVAMTIFCEPVKGNTGNASHTTVKGLVIT